MPPYKRKYISEETVAKRLKALVRPRRRRVSRIKGKISKNSTELKSHSMAAATFEANTTGSILLLNGIGEGDGVNARDALNIELKYIDLIFTVQPAQDLVVDQTVRVMLVWDNAVNGNAQSTADLLTATNALSHYNVSYEDRLSVLMDVVIAGGSRNVTATTAQSSATNMTFRKRIPLNAITKYYGTGATVASIQNGSLYAHVIGTVAAAQSTNYQVVLASKLRYIDV